MPAFGNPVTGLTVFREHRRIGQNDFLSPLTLELNPLTARRKYPARFVAGSAPGLVRSTGYLATPVRLGKIDLRRFQAIVLNETEQFDIQFLAGCQADQVERLADLAVGRYILEEHEAAVATRGEHQLVAILEDLAVGQPRLGVDRLAGRQIGDIHLVSQGRQAQQGPGNNTGDMA
ncbi:hypothetical protein SDC9_149309 [bioreactor metagenome]|uniref:Uncharacterized protein n=1 Tax=bioreactor metagenome TaxID=1076179 RepID=A0A645EKV4_9ZZZZ